MRSTHSFRDSVGKGHIVFREGPFGDELLTARSPAAKHARSGGRDRRIRLRCCILEWDARAERFPNNAAANQWLSYQYRAPYKLG